VIAGAFWYLRGDGPTIGGFHGDGVGVPPEDLLAVEVAPALAGESRPRSVRP